MAKAGDGGLGVGERSALKRVFFFNLGLWPMDLAFAVKASFLRLSSQKVIANRQQLFLSSSLNCVSCVVSGIGGECCFRCIATA